MCIPKSNWEKQMKSFTFLFIFVSAVFLDQELFCGWLQHLWLQKWKKKQQKQNAEQKKNKTKSQTNHFQNLKHLKWHAPVSIFTTPLAPMRQFHLKSDVKAYMQQEFLHNFEQKSRPGLTKGFKSSVMALPWSSEHPASDYLHIYSHRFHINY